MSDTRLHDLDYSDIDELDDIDGDYQYVLIWCDTHLAYEWHWIDRDRLPDTHKG